MLYFLCLTWPISRHLISIYCRIAKIDSPVDTTDRRVFYSTFKGLVLPLIEESGSPKNDTQYIVSVFRHIKQLVEVWDLVVDEKSKKTLLAILKCRLTRDVKELSDISEKDEHQYFDYIVTNSLKNHQVIFVDAGGYTGDSSTTAIEKIPSIERIYFYEPDSESIKMARRELKKKAFAQKIVWEKAGLSNAKKQVTLYNKGSASSLRTENDNDKGETIQLSTLDNDIGEKVNFIKMDIEGEELNALEGARRHITEDSPLLAICVYHKTDDLWGIPLYVLSLNKGYKMYLRHYKEVNLSETVFYCVPNINV